MESELERRVSRLEARLDALQGFTRPASSPPPPPPPPPPRRVVPQFEVSTPAEKVPGIDPEYRLGATIMPRIGGSIVVLGLGTLVSIGIRQGWITPTMLFSAVCALCLGLIALGVRIRDERKQFGHLLTAVGSSGLYLNFAAGALVQNLYPDGVMIALFAGLSLVNVAWGFASRSPVFLCMGLLGGIAAAWLPLPRTGLAATLHFLILVPSLLVAWKHRWEEWSAATIALGLVSAHVIGGSMAAIAVPLLYATGAVSLVAFAMTTRGEELALFAPVPVVASLLLHFDADLGIHPSVRILVMAGLYALIAQLAMNEKVHRVIVASAAWSAAVLVPASLHGPAPAALYLSEALVFAGWCLANRKHNSLPWVPFVLGLAATAFFGLVDRDPAQVLGLLAMALVVLVPVGLVGRGESREVASLLSPLIVIGMVIPTSTLSGHTMPFLAGLLLGLWSLFPAIGAALLGDLRVGRMGYATLLLAWLASWTAALDGIPFGHESILFGVALLATVVVAHMAVRLGESRMGANLWVLTATALATTRLAVAAHDAGMVAGSLNGLITGTWIGLLVLAFGLGFWRDRAELRYAGFTIAAVTVGKVILVDLAATDPIVRVALLLTLGGVLLAFGHQYIRRQRLSGRGTSAA